MNLEALVNFLSTDPAYDADVREGHNGVICKRLNAPDTALSKRWRPIPATDFLDAIAGESLTVQQEERIRTYAQDGRPIPIHKSGVRAWIQAQGFAVSTIQALRDLSEVEGKPADQFLDDEDEEVSIQDIRKAVAQIGKAHINQPAPLRDPSEKLAKGIKKDLGSPLKEFDEE